MKIAAVSEDQRTIAQHFGRAPYYVVVTVEGEAVLARETRPKAGHRDFVAADPGPDAKHRAMAQSVADCTVLLAGGMGGGAFAALQAAGIEPVLTDERDIETAALRYARGQLPNLADRVHEHRGGHEHGAAHGD
jgi:predicted Fe-Mo cluster-binding NifX family protein